MACVVKAGIGLPQSLAGGVMQRRDFIKVIGGTGGRVAASNWIGCGGWHPSAQTSSVHCFERQSPLTAASTLTKSKVCADQFVRSAAHTQRKPNGGCYAPGLLKPR